MCAPVAGKPGKLVQIPEGQVKSLCTAAGAPGAENLKRSVLVPAGGAVPMRGTDHLLGSVPPLGAGGLFASSVLALKSFGAIPWQRPGCRHP